MSATGDTPPAWHRDPLGRHEFRYWDGATWTARVSDAGQISADPIGAGPAPASSGPASASSGPAPAASGPVLEGYGPTPSPAPPPAGRSSTGRLLAIGAVVAVVVIGGLFAFKALRGDDGTGVTSGAITSDGDIAVREVSLSEGDVLRVLLTPENGFDPSLAIGITPETFARYDFGDSSDATIGYNPASDSFFSDADEAIACDVSSDDFSEDVGDVECREGRLIPLYASYDDGDDEGDQQFVTLIAPASGTYGVMVRGEDGDEGTFRLRVDRASTGAQVDDEFYSDGFSDVFSDNREFFCPDDSFFGDDELSDFYDDGAYDCAGFSDSEEFGD